MIESRNLILAIVLSVGILFAFEFLYRTDAPPPPPAGQQGTTEMTQGQTGDGGAPPAPTAQAPGSAVSPPAPPGGGLVPSPTNARADTLEATPRVVINTPRLHGSINLIGGRIDDLTLADYRQTLDPDSPEIVLLSPTGAQNAFFANVGWVVAGGAEAMPMPGPQTQWTADGGSLTTDSPVTLSWDNGAGLRFTRTLTVDENYLFSVTQRVENTGNTPATLYPYGLIARHGTPEVTGFFILHEGLLGVFDGTLKEVDYDELQETADISQGTTGGWLGITDKYWLAALVPDPEQTVDTRFTHRLVDNRDVYQTDFRGGGMTIVPGGQISSVTRLFAGAKEVRLLDGYSEAFNIEGFDRAIDFGWFYFLTKPIFYFMIYINDHVGNFGIAILLLTVAIKVAFFPLANKSYRAMSQMKKLQPEMVKLRERFGDDRTRLNQEMMALYKREKVSPASGCLPMLIQIPVFFALYKVLFVTIEMRHAPFFGWIQDLSAPDPTTLFNLFGLIPWQPPEILLIGIWPLIMGASMFLQQRLNPQPPDPLQAKIFLALPFIFTIMLARFPAGLVIYWAWNNVLSILQQWVIMRRMGAKV